MSAPKPKLRLDKWLWHARFFKTRGLAAKTVSAGHVRVNSTKVSKPAQSVGAGDVLTFPQGRQIRVVQVEALGERRGPAPEAQMLYTDLTPPEDNIPPAPRFEGKGRPSKRDRRMFDLDRARELE
ncbi:Heat shock protein 15 [Thalassovita gelatinovora]|uniref:Heat shock protein 15 n=1 Tax=Thalassovita gelatinovora TaxID=53501 RepID=A0A0P1F729_THAGE|nr:RNA-binding S4 domain-containing protein [Thalassovita gelatinovora]QIZ82254.1 RNA-binding S4 domain-containing protein [Thalassovita gelatinovora]CUH63788.1 Heat shock protein 15 [Thalassovita gelatinovora]SEQ97651.1 heat shock protein Hsp15 [Thalassovita gelatinovora]